MSLQQHKDFNFLIKREREEKNLKLSHFNFPAARQITK